MIVSTLVNATIFIMCLLSIICVIHIDVYNVLKLNDTETNIDMVEFEKCILPYRSSNS